MAVVESRTARADRHLRASVLGAALLAMFLSAFVACTVEPEPAPTVVIHNQGPESPAPVEFPVTGETAAPASIVTGELLTSDPGQGAGLFVTYLGGGNWRLTTTCDTNVTGYTCGFAYTLRSASAWLAEPVLDRKDGTMQLVRYAEGYDVAYIGSTGVDGLTARVDPPGAPLEVAVWLDGEPDARLLYWVAPEGVQQGARTNPTRFVPTTP